MPIRREVPRIRGSINDSLKAFLCRFEAEGLKPVAPPLKHAPSGLDLSPGRQKALLRSACFGAAFCTEARAASSSSSSANPEPAAPSSLASSRVFYTVCCKLRVLNALREPQVGVPLTLVQLDTLSLEVVVSRLVAYREWLLAYRIAGTVLHHQRASSLPTPQRLTSSPYSTSLCLPGRTLQEKVGEAILSFQPTKKNPTPFLVSLCFKGGPSVGLQQDQFSLFLGSPGL